VPLLPEAKTEVERLETGDLERLFAVQRIGEFGLRESRVDRRGEFGVREERETGKLVGLEVVVYVEGGVVVLVDGGDTGEGEEAGENDDGASELREETGASGL
jgi:hypothetical protein